MNKKTFIIYGATTVIALIVGLMIWGRGAWVRKQDERERELSHLPAGFQPVQTRSTSASEGLLDINASTWIGRGVPPGKDIDSWPITEDVEWQIRVNQKTIHNLSPINAKNGKVVDLGTNVFYYEWRVKPGQKVTEAKLFYREVPLRSRS